MASKTPTGLKAAGRRLWRSVVDEYELEEHEAALLLQACRIVDRLDGIDVELEGAALVVPGERGSTKAHPLLGEQRGQMLALSRLLASLRLPSGDQEAGEGLRRPQRRGASRGAYGIRGAVQ
ncbi:hypothetical protein GCM10023153_24710 [Ornithinibacter aureus]|uniref:Terminase n=1 Tax=Ornithinibacter aureus TaxID=622664 RepID=A0ABP8K195_9MICO|nr:hypothetical protein [Ornithinibacter aureus]KAF0833081.1 hypothetical protein C8E84_0853 [Ornithinibacter aureus]